MKKELPIEIKISFVLSVMLFVVGLYTNQQIALGVSMILLSLFSCTVIILDAIYEKK